MAGPLSSNARAAASNASKPSDAPVVKIEKIDGRRRKRRNHPKKRQGQSYGKYIFEKQVIEKFGTMDKGLEQQLAELSVCSREPEHARKDVKDDVEIKAEPED